MKASSIHFNEIPAWQKVSILIPPTCLLRSLLPQERKFCQVSLLSTTAAKLHQSTSLQEILSSINRLEPLYTPAARGSYWPASAYRMCCCCCCHSYFLVAYHSAEEVWFCLFSARWLLQLGSEIVMGSLTHQQNPEASRWVPANHLTSGLARNSIEWIGSTSTRLTFNLSQGLHV